jgi:glutathione S-transferase
MKVFYSAYSPFVRKVLVAAAELGLTIERVPSPTNPMAQDPAILKDNPLGQVPTLHTDDGIALYDSRVIIEYLDSLGGGKLLSQGALRWTALVEQATADGMLNAALSMRYEEVLRPAEIRSAAWTAAQQGKVTEVLDYFEARVAGFGARVDVGTITLACGLAYLDLRFPQQAWRSRPGLAAWFATFAQRPAMLQTVHPA